MNERTKNILLYTVLAAVLLLLPLTAMTRGVVSVELQEVIRFLLQPEHPQIPPIHADVLAYMRAPRFLLALLAGSTLAVVGAVMQALLRNPLADPYFLGISSGAALGAVLMMYANITVFAGLSAVPLGAFAGAGGATFLVLWLTHYYGRGKSFMILIAGMGIHAVCSAAVSLVISLAPSSRTVANISYWLLGSLEKASWEKDLYLAAIALPILLFFLLQTRILNLMLLGDETARTLGYRLEKRRLLFILLCAAATAMVVYNVGIIGFVGLAVPHIARLLVGGSYTKLLPVCAALGAGALAWADVFSRLAVENGELPIGIVVSLLGSPVFLHLLLKRKRS